MSAGLQYRENQATAAQIAGHLASCDRDFVPRLSSRVDLHAYAAKIASKATRFEAWYGDTLAGLVAAYMDDGEKRSAFITSVSVLREWCGKGVAAELLGRCLVRARAAGMRQVSLEASSENAAAVARYAKCGFVVRSTRGTLLSMHLDLEHGGTMGVKRDYNAELDDSKNAENEKYAYGFDYDVMHPFMIRSFEPFFRKGSLLELGSYTGAFTRRFLPHFDDITCVEGSDVALAEARKLLGDRVKFVHALFETVALPKRYDNIVLTHVLEHLDDPVRVLKRINDEWLTDSGRLFLVCPNANAPSRQIAVKMGLITHNAAVTPAESEHGHRCTYSLDTLERDAVAAGLKVVHRSGVFFKALANFQWDRLLKTDIVSKEYLEGCYKLGHLYPDLCSSIFLMCERGEPR